MHVRVTLANVIQIANCVTQIYLGTGYFSITCVFVVVLQEDEEPRRVGIGPGHRCCGYTDREGRQAPTISRFMQSPHYLGTTRIEPTK